MQKRCGPAGHCGHVLVVDGGRLLANALGVAVHAASLLAQPCFRLPCCCRHTLSSVKLSGPTLFEPIITTAAQVGATRWLGGSACRLCITR